MGTAIVITSGKGGTGKSSFTVGVASCLAAMGKQVLCIDMDIGLRNLDLSLGSLQGLAQGWYSTDCFVSQSLFSLLECLPPRLLHEGEIHIYLV